ncbi:hypothetical protein D7Y41_02820 [Anaerotruncus sp. 1XD22-93]|nr:hypothetical protein [Lachnospiraceae bacterium]NBI74204.1 hypothetical protein [Lachnospiraceae bacterium]RKK00407.1 hypothetical protein D7Y41_02820 [Anaerotruncus sp. 1XD22-93]
MGVTLCRVQNFEEHISADSQVRLAVEFEQPIRLPGITIVPDLKPPKELLAFYSINKGRNLQFQELITELYKDFLNSLAARVGIRIITDYDFRKKEIMVVCNPDSFFDYTLLLDECLKDHGIFTKYFITRRE